MWALRGHCVGANRRVRLRCRSMRTTIDSADKFRKLIDDMIGPDIATVAFGLASALSWGAGDFSGGLATKRAPVWTVVVIGHGVGLLLMIGLALLWGEPLLPSIDLAWGVAAGMAGAVGI